MKTIRLLLIQILLLTGLQLSAQTLVSVNRTITQDELLATVRSNIFDSKTVTASGQAIFSSKSGYVRILLSDNNGYDLLVYESSPLLATNGVDNFNNRAIESIDIPANSALIKIRVEMKNAELKNLSVVIPNIPLSKSQQLQVKSDRISLINNNLRVQNALWVAGETPISQMTYEEKKVLFGGTVPDLQGAEYYVGGIFEISENGSSPNRMINTSKAPSAIVSNFDWRNRHGRNWTTSVKKQAPCNTCWAFAATGAVEGLVNLYYNQKIDLDLSEQEIVSCTGDDCNSGGSILDALNYIIASGVVKETCFPYSSDTNVPPCNNKCNNPTENIKIAGIQTFSPHLYSDPVSELKKLIIQKGMIGAYMWAWGHAMTLVGFGTIQAGDIVYNEIVGDDDAPIPITINANDPRIGQTYWLFKNSWGEEWGSDGGYLYVICDISQLNVSRIPLSPITSIARTNSDIVCEDRDGDGYYFWGIGPKPAHCPPCAPYEPDGDDSNPNLGPMDEYGNCAEITPLTENITTSQTWNTNRTFCKNITVKSGVVLTITMSSTIFMSDHTIIIENGGKLILSGGTVDTGYITAKSGGELTISNNGKVLLGKYSDFDMQLGVIFNLEYGAVSLK